jgi:hypothetical protein
MQNFGYFMGKNRKFSNLVIILIVIFTIWHFFVKKAWWLSNCEVYSSVFIVEPSMTVISNGRWMFNNNLSAATGNYIGEINFVKPGEKVRKEKVVVSFELQHEVVGFALKTTTKSVSLHFGNQATKAEIEKYVYAGLQENYVNFNRFFFIQGVRFASGEDKSATNICRSTF